MQNEKGKCTLESSGVGSISPNFVVNFDKSLGSNQRDFATR